jgi:phytoene dehydrogenase-like protein
MTARMEAQVERFAPGFRDLILARHVLAPADLERRNPNLAGGDISGGSVSLPHLFLRPTSRLYRTSRRDLFICSASTPPGSGVHGLCGYYAANEALATCLR